MSPSTMTQGPIARRILRLAFPLLVGNVIQQFYNITDTLIVGRYAGSTAYAALGVAGTVMNLFLFLLAGCCTGVALLSASLYGSGDESALRREFALALMLGLGFALALGVFAAAVTGPVLGLIRTPAALLGAAKSYLYVIFLGLGATFLYNLFAAMLRAVGNSLAALIFLVIAMVTNVGLDLLFVAKLGFGIAGAAWATVAAQLLSALLCGVYLYRKMPALRLARKDFCWDGALAATTARYALVTALHQSSLYVGKLLVQGAVNGMGLAAISAYTATSRIEALALTFGDSCTEAMSVFLAQNHGAKKPERMRAGFFCGMVFLTGLAVAFTVLFSTAAPALTAFFLPADSPEALAEGVRYFHLLVWFQLPGMLLSGFVGYFRGIGRVDLPFLGTVFHISVRVVLSYLLADRLGLGAVAVACGTGWSCVVVFQAWMWRRLQTDENAHILPARRRVTPPAFRP